MSNEDVNKDDFDLNEDGLSQSSYDLPDSIRLSDAFNSYISAQKRFKESIQPLIAATNASMYHNHAAKAVELVSASLYPSIPVLREISKTVAEMSKAIQSAVPNANFTEMVSVLSESITSISESDLEDFENLNYDKFEEKAKETLLHIEDKYETDAIEIIEPDNNLISEASTTKGMPVLQKVLLIVQILDYFFRLLNSIGIDTNTLQNNHSAEAPPINIVISSEIENDKELAELIKELVESYHE